jgi:hypothetical protein
MENDDDVTIETVPQSKQHLITNEKFNLLKECQQNIFITTEISPSMRKIINELITEENLQVIKSKFIAIFS